MLPVEVIATKRDGGALTAEQIGDFVGGLVDGRWSDSQAAALAMAIVLRGMSRDETVALTRAMTHSGQVLRWDDAALAGPVLDKHSTGGVGDKVSLMLAPIVAACGGVVPMVSGRGLGHTGGTLDKLEALPGYRTDPPRPTLLAALRNAGCAIVGAGAELAPADRRLYAVRDVTATVESVPLITASILSKKLAAGLQGLVLDVKCGSGAFAARRDDALALAGSLVAVARGAGLPACALVTDMNAVLGRTAGNALEVQEAIDYLTGAHREPRLHAVTRALSAELLLLGGLAPTLDAALARVDAALASGAAAERFERMVAALGGPADALRSPHLPTAPVVRPVRAAGAGVVGAVDVRALGHVVVALGGGRRKPGDAVDARVGLVDTLAPGSRVDAGDALSWVHAADEAGAQAAVQALLQAMPLLPPGSAPAPAAPLVERLALD